MRWIRRRFSRSAAQNEIATDLSATLNRYQALGAAFAGVTDSAETGAALSEAGGAALVNIAVLDAQGHLLSEMKSSPRGFLPLDPVLLTEAQGARVVIPSADSAARWPSPFPFPATLSPYRSTRLR